MEIKKLPYNLSVCKVTGICDVNVNTDFFFIGKTAEELSLVCETKSVPIRTTAREDGWKGFYIVGQLDFSLVGVLSKLTAILAEEKIGIFAVSTYNTDYILVKDENFERAISALSSKGYKIV